MHFSTLIAAFMLPLAVLGIALPADEGLIRSFNIFILGYQDTLNVLDGVLITLEPIAARQVPLYSRVAKVIELVKNGATSVHTSFSPIRQPHVLQEEYVEAYSYWLVRVLTTVFVLPA